MAERRIRFRSYCQGCRYGTRWGTPIGQRRSSPPRRDLCAWRRHRFDWEYIVEQNGCRIATRGGFATRERAEASAQRTWAKLAVALGDAA